MTNQNEQGTDESDVNRNENKFMYISVGVVVLLLLGGMGINMLVHHDAPASTVETTRPAN